MSWVSYFNLNVMELGTLLCNGSSTLSEYFYDLDSTTNSVSTSRIHEVHLVSILNEVYFHIRPNSL